MPEINELIEICRFAGERFDLVQAAAGNASLQLPDGTLWIKGSGLSLSDVTSQSDLAHVTLEKPVEFIKSSAAKGVDLSSDQIDKQATDCVMGASKADGKRPSNETFMHCLLGPLTLHTHPPVVTSIVCQRGWRERIAALVPEALCVDYHTPGIRTAIALAKVLQESKWQRGTPAVIFLQNHGLVVSASTANEVAALTNDVVAKLSYFLGVDWSRYRLSNRLRTDSCHHRATDLFVLQRRPRAVKCRKTQPIGFAGPTGISRSSRILRSSRAGIDITR